MYSPASLTAYRAARSEGHSPRTIRAILRARPPVYPLTWKDGRGSDVAAASLTVSGFDVRCTVVYDQAPEDDTYGSFSARKKDGAIDRRTFGDKPGFNECRYWIPPYSEAERRSENRTYRKLGKHEADTEARAWIRAMYRKACDNLAAYDLRVDVYRAGVKLATAWLGLGLDGYDRASEREAWFTDVAQDVIPDAIQQAREALAGLCDCGGNEDDGNEEARAAK